MRRLYLIGILVLLTAAAAHAQTATTGSIGRVRDLKLNSKLMAREMPYRVILPVEYGASRDTNSYPVIYLLHGLFGHYDNWTDKTGIVEYSKKYRFIIVTPEGENGWYSDSPVKAHNKFESYIVQELIPEIDRKFRTVKDRRGRSIAGLSMGGYGAIKFGLKYPEMFSLAGSFSGAIGAATLLDKIPGSVGRTIDSIFGPSDSEVRRSNDVFRMIREITPDKKSLLPFIYLDCGTEDFLFVNNREFSDLLNQKSIPHEYRELPGGHNWKFWDSQVREFLQIADRRGLNVEKAQ
jgi:S-formylglutathione hydrolase FrmB